MNWFRRLIAPQNQPFFIYLLVVASLAGCAFLYRGAIQRRHLAHLAAATRRAFTSQDGVPAFKMERSTLEFELSNLPSHFPVLSNPTLAGDWTAAAAASQLDARVRQTWNACWAHISPLVVRQNPDLATFATLQEAYDTDVALLAEDIAVQEKEEALKTLRRTKYATLFESPIYLADRAAFDEAARKIAEAAALALRHDHCAALVEVATNLHPHLAAYGGALLDMETRAHAIQSRLEWLNEKLASLGEVRIPAQPPGPKRGWFAPMDRLLNRESFAGVCKPGDFLPVGVTAAVICFLITIPIELRDRRWLKIAVSAGLACLGMLVLQVPFGLTIDERIKSIFPLITFFFPAVLLAAVWTPSLAFWGSRLFMALVDAAEVDVPDYTSLSAAYSAVRRDDFREALRWVKPHLVASEKQYEALVLKARLHRRLNQRRRANWALKRALRIRNLTDKQRQHVATLLDHLDDSAHPGWLL